MKTARCAPFPFCCGKTVINLENVEKSLETIRCTLEDMACVLSTISEGQCTTNSELLLMRQSLTSTFPMVAKVEYPEEVDGTLVYYWRGYNFRDYVLGPLNIYFSGRIDSNLPVYIVDDTNFGLVVTAPGTPDVQLNGVSEELVNKLIPATCQGNYIHLE